MAARSTDYDTLALGSGEDASPPAKGGDEGTSNNNNKWILLLIGVVVVGLAATKTRLFGSEAPALHKQMISNTFQPEDTFQWPTQLFHKPMSFPGLPPTNLPWPTDTALAASEGWVKGSEDCVPELGEVWLFEGKRTPFHSAALYFSPAVGGVPGQLTGVEVDYYGKILKGLVGSYFSKEKLDQDSVPYHSVAAGFRDPKKYDLCDSGTPLPGATEKYLAVAPQMMNVEMPTTEADAELVDAWHEGSCLEGMGYHWFKNAFPDAGKELTYKHDSVMPVVPMYHPITKDISGIFFYAPERLQVWDDDVCNQAFATSDGPTLFGCFSNNNFWDPGPGLLQMSAGPLFMCKNTCDADCSFEDSYDGTISTMHFFFYPGTELPCGDPKMAHCRNGFDWTGWTHKGPPKQLMDHPVCRDDIISPSAEYFTAEKLSKFLHGPTSEKLLYTEEEMSDLISRVDPQSGERNDDPMTFQVRLDYIHEDCPNCILDYIYKAAAANNFPSPLKDIGFGFSQENALWGERLQINGKIVLNILTVRKSNEDGTMSEVPPDYNFTPGDIVYLIPATEIGFPIKHVRIELTNPGSTGVIFSGYGVTLEDSGVVDFVAGFKSLMVPMDFGLTDVIISPTNCAPPVQLKD